MKQFRKNCRKPQTPIRENRPKKLYLPVLLLRLLRNMVLQSPMTNTSRPGTRRSRNTALMKWIRSQAELTSKAAESALFNAQHSAADSALQQARAVISESFRESKAFEGSLPEVECFRRVAAGSAASMVARALQLTDMLVTRFTALLLSGSPKTKTRAPCLFLLFLSIMPFCDNAIYTFPFSSSSAPVNSAV